MTEKRKKQLRQKVLLFAGKVLERTAESAIMPDSKSDEEDEWMREELGNIAVDLYEEAHLP
jgi:hypothetical protein